MKDLFGNPIEDLHGPDEERLYIEEKQAGVYSRAKSVGCTPYSIVKRDLFYRIMRASETGKISCIRCRYNKSVKWLGDAERLGCEQIGISNNPEARVNKNGTCSKAKFKRGKV